MKEAMNERPWHPEEIGETWTAWVIGREPDKEKRLEAELPSLEPPPDLKYAVIDEIVEGLATLVVSDWPRDRDGRRVIASEPEDDIVVTLPTPRLQRWIDHYRTRDADVSACELAPQRALRIGDAFAIASPLVDHLQSAAEEDLPVDLSDDYSFPEIRGTAAALIDVTKSARYAAKVASTGMLSTQNESPPDTPPGPRPRTVFIARRGDQIEEIPILRGTSYWIVVMDEAGSWIEVIAEGQV